MLSASLLTIKGFSDFTLKEKLQLMLGTALEEYAADRPFVKLAFKALLDSPMRTFTELAQVRAKYLARVQHYFAVAIEREEIPPQPFERLLVNLLWDYRNLILLYWLRDDSKGFANTTTLVDRSLEKPPPPRISGADVTAHKRRQHSTNSGTNECGFRHCTVSILRNDSPI